MRIHFCCLLLAALLTYIGFTACVTGQSSSESTQSSRADSEVRADVANPIEFNTGKDGRPLLVSVDWGDENFLFILDTGASKTGIDSSLKRKLGNPIGHTKLLTSAGPVDSELYACPQATIAGVALEGIEAVYCTDLQPLRCAMGEDVRGVLGADFLQRFSVTIDFDKGRVQLSQEPNSVSVAGATIIPLELDESGRPYLLSTIGENSNELVLVDTGATGDSLRAQLFDSLVQSRKIATCDAQLGLTAGGSFRQQSGFLNTLSVDGFQLKEMRVARHFENSIGLDCLSRFHVTLDFHNRRILLRKGKQFQRLFSRATSGMAVVDINGRKTVVQVKRYSPASSAGVSQGDKVVAINGQRADRLDMFEVGQLLTSSVGAPVELTLARGLDTFSTTFHLADRLGPAAEKIR
jgi:hypothetical protein